MTMTRLSVSCRAFCTVSVIFNAIPRVSSWLIQMHKDAMVLASLPGFSESQHFPQVLCEVIAIPRVRVVTQAQPTISLFLKAFCRVIVVAQVLLQSHCGEIPSQALSEAIVFLSYTDNQHLSQRLRDILDIRQQGIDPGVGLLTPNRD
ncbi:hypothetical protein H1C71_007990 [Ictidomys tridecemlineatus]|nr:hypothetical protein H1C71_007990 [Ictidomys tridecemlineatus]